MLAFDHRGSFKKYVKPANPDLPLTLKLLALKLW